MATRTPLVISSGEKQQLQSGDPLIPIALLRVLDQAYTLPANTSLEFKNSLTLSNVSFTIPDTCSVSVTTGEREYWDTYVKVGPANFVTTSASLVNVTGLTYAAAVNSVYEVEATLRVQVSQSTGMRFGVACSAAGSTGQYMGFGGGNQNSATLNYEVGAIGTDNTANKITSINVDCMLKIFAVVVTAGATGNITIQVFKGSSGFVTIYAGSVMKIKKLM